MVYTVQYLAVVAAVLPSAVLAQNNQSYANYSSQSQPDLYPQTLATLNLSFPDCINGPLKDNIVCNTSVNYVERAEGLISLFTLEELINNTQNSAPGVPRLGLPPYQVWSEGLHGLDRANWAKSGEEWKWATSFPMPILSMAALNRTLINQIASIIATQARAFNNVGRYGLDAYAPNINGFRSPLWGRGQETPGEDAGFLSSSYAYEYITGLQGGVDPEHLKIVATAKHFAGYDLENWNNNSRLGFDASITQQDLAEYYTPQFLAASRYAKARSFMCSYNSVNGVPSCSSSFLLQTLLRENWDFPDYGYVSSDCDAAYNVFNPHGYAINISAAAADSLRAGTDIDCGQTYPWYLNQSFIEGSVTRGEIERSLIRLYSNLVKLGYFDGNQSEYRQLGWNDVVATDAWNISYEAAVEGIVLLKNDGVLPLSEKLKSVAVIGPWANATQQLQGNYFGPAPYLITPLQAARDAGYKVNYAFGTNILGNTTDGFAAALSAAKKSDVIIYLGGIDNTIEAEGTDRMNVTWPGNQLDLIQQLSQTGKPLVVLQMGGGQVDSSSLKSNNNVNALVWGGYPGQSGGKAIFDILSGKRAPAGRLVTTQYPAEYATQFPATDMNLRPDGKSNPGQTYIWYTGKPVYEFGYALFYTTFKETAEKLASSSFDISDIIASPRSSSYAYSELVPFVNVTATIKNTGKTASPYTAMLFANTTNAGPTPYPNKWLVGYDRLPSIEPGKSTELVIPVPIGAISRVDENGNRIVYPGDYQLALNVDRSVVWDIKLTGNAVTIENWPLDEQEIKPDHK
ncbi:beta-xylosidase XylA [Talaromyces stipitatus ATCC 10500]|uniref:xylan 1,4-beta-xylosidase n=1 Tax=Talaromyces stipitatus (strain ATCC 10500 / CBS 375.48 / QM 6759 / NRRL 1006) TaxID=441959 RepID=B8M137_TALSN|nr:beta-xylosidase XylA [Talaromyces stipitatus ATCC 10500]EED20979.1 beta-xylosidase XylA [Talaromyces stipitatus ATCC 10500]